MAYYCPNHGVLDDPWCSDCGQLLDSLDEDTPEAESAADLPPLPSPVVPFKVPSKGAAESGASGGEMFSVSPRGWTATEPEPELDPGVEPQLVETSASSTVAAGTTATASSSPSPYSDVAAEHRALKEYIDDGYEIYLAVGVAGCGKTQLLDAFEKQYGLLRVGGGYNPLGLRMKSGRALPTDPGVVYCHPVAVGKRKVVLVDSAGEDFQYLYPDMWRTGQIDQRVLGFLRLVAQNLSGLILLIDLHRLWMSDKPVDEQQIEIQTWILFLLRWLRTGETYPEHSHLPFQEYINSRVRSGKIARLSCPVQILYSKADEVRGLEVPASSVPWARRDQDRRLDPTGEDPFFFTFHALRDFYNTLVRSARHFRFDFAHALVINRQTELVESKIPNGILLSVEWLLDPSWRRVPSWAILSTPFWVKVQRLVDRLRGRRERWRRLLPPKSL